MGYFHIFTISTGDRRIGVQKKSTNNTVDGSEIRRSPVRSHYLQFQCYFYIPGGAGFLSITSMIVGVNTLYNCFYDIVKQFIKHDIVKHDVL